MFKFLVKKPILFLALFFLTIILLGTLLLSLPQASVGGISFLDALFTAVSASTVTGLVVKNTALDFTVFGQSIILFLIQIGGLGIVAGAAFIFLVFKRVGISTGAGLKAMLEEDYISDVKKTTVFIFLTTLAVEMIGAVLLFFWWRNDFSDTGSAVFGSVFHAVSAFVNAGFSIFENNLEGFRGDVFTNIVVILLIFLGGIGFLVLGDLFRKFKLFLRGEKSSLEAYSKAVLAVTLILVVAGATLFWLFERQNLSSFSAKDMFLVSFFQSVAARTAGLNTVEIGQLTSPTHLLFIFLMFVGGAPTSIAGGIKVVSLLVIFLVVVSFFRRERDIVFGKRTVPKSLLRNVFVLISVYLFFCFAVLAFLLYTEKGNFEELLFEVFSATGTVGLSLGVTPYLTSAGKVLIIISMFVGRLLPLSLAIIGSREMAKTKIVYPEEKIILG
jgi:trk system potassium uptake protein TrkH